MPDDEIRIERVKVKDLYYMAQEIISDARPGQFIPITKQRALALSKNPYADPEDVGLLVAYQGEQLVGYFGIMAVMLRHGGQMSRVQWFTTWMVHPEHRGKRIGSLLMAEALKLEKDYLIVGSAPARRVCRNFGFHEFEPLVYYLIDLRVAGRYNPLTLLLRAVRKAFGLVGVKVDISGLNRRVELAFNRLFAPIVKPLVHSLLQRKVDTSLAGYMAKPVERLRPLAFSPAPDEGTARLYRGPEIVNWMLAYPWVLESGQSESENLDYYFTDARPRFDYLALEVHSRQGADYLGYLALQLSQVGEKLALRVLDHEFAQPRHRKCVLPLAVRYARVEGVDTIEIPKELAAPLRNTFIGRLTLVEKQRITQCHPKSPDSPLGRSWRDMELDHCDGDIPFT